MKDEHIITQSDKGNIYFKIICNSVGDGGENVFVYLNYLREMKMAETMPLLLHQLHHRLHQNV